MPSLINGSGEKGIFMVGVSYGWAAGMDGWMLRFWRESRWRRRHSNNRAITSSRSSSTRIVVTAGQKSRTDEDACLSLRFLSSLVRFTHYFNCWLSPLLPKDNRADSLDSSHIGPMAAGSRTFTFHAWLQVSFRSLNYVHFVVALMPFTL